MSDTLNELKDFHMCLALGEQCVNDIFASSWATWRRRRDLKLGGAGDGTFSHWAASAPGRRELGVSFRVGAPRLSFHRDLEPKVQVLVPVRDVVAVAEDPGSGRYFDATCAEAEVLLPVRFRSRMVDLAALRATDPAAAAAAEEAIRHGGEADWIFSLEHLFLAISGEPGAGGVAFGGVGNVRQGDFGGPIDGQIHRSLRHIFGDSEFPLGTVVRRTPRTPAAKASFALSDCAVFGRSRDGAVGTLCYMGMFDGKLPEDPHTKAKAMDHDWIARELVDGTKASVHGRLHIQRDYFLHRYLRGAIERGLKKARERDPALGEFNVTLYEDAVCFKSVREQSEDRWAEGLHIKGNREIVTEFNFSTFSTASAGIVPGLRPTRGRGTPTLGMKGAVRDRHYRDIIKPVKIDLVVKEFDADIHGITEFVGESFIEGEIHFTERSNVISTGTALRAEYDLQSDMKVGLGPLEVRQTVDKGMAQEYSALFKAFGLLKSDFGEMMGAAFTQVATVVKSATEESLKELESSVDELAFIPPGGGVFTFSNFHFSQHSGDLVLDVLYKAPVGGAPRA